VIKGFGAVLRRACGELITVEITLASRIRSVQVDIPQFEAALLNLVVNARDAMPEGGKIMISSRNVRLDRERANMLGLQPGSYVALTVGDSGTGIPEDARPRVFEPFFTTKDVGKGTGLGLSQVYGFVTQSGGQVELDSEIGKGTRIHLFIPAVSGGEGEGEGEGEDEARQPPRQTLGTVLIVEDEPDVSDRGGRARRSGNGHPDL
jgi:signal transduction histidine kinase